MRKVLAYSVLLLIGLGASQILPSALGDNYRTTADAIRILTMAGLAFIMIHVGFEFHIDKSNLRQYGWDYFVAFTAASFPWVFVTAYFMFVLLPPEFWGNFDAWTEVLLAGRFAAPTSAGVLFSMLAAAGLGSTWLFRKARILAIFDDLDTVLLMIPLKVLMVGLAWQLGLIFVVMAAFLWVAYAGMHRVTLPVSWNWVLGYAVVIAGLSELVYSGSRIVDPSVPIHIEVLLPAFVLGCIARPRGSSDARSAEHALHAVLEHPVEQRANFLVSATFMVLVGLSMPPILGGTDFEHPAPSASQLHAAAPASAVDDPTVHGGRPEADPNETVTGSQPSLGWRSIAIHTFLLTILANLGKMFPAFCYRREAHWRERLAIAIGMWPRGEVGAGVLVLSLSYGIGGPIVTIAMLSLAQRTGTPGPDDPSRTTKARVSYHGVPVVSHRIAFVLDLSGSMRDPAGDGTARSLLEVAMEELARVIDELPEKGLFNIYFYNEETHPWRPEAAPATPRARKEAKAFLAKKEAKGYTNLYGGLQRALADLQVDTIYLLSDGGPSRGEVIFTDRILRKVDELNRIRRVTIHAIDTGSRKFHQTRLLEELAARTGGRYVRIVEKQERPEKGRDG